MDNVFFSNKDIGAKEAIDLVSILNKFSKTSVYLKKHLDKQSEDIRQVDAKSVLGLLSLGIKNGDKLEISSFGPDREQLINRVIEWFTTDDDQFYERVGLMF